MKRRLRKKKRVGEFRELGFQIRAELRDGIEDPDFEAFMDRWIGAVEARQLAFGGGGGRDGKFEGFVTRAERGSATDDDRQALAAFLEGDVAIARREVGELRDAEKLEAAWRAWLPTYCDSLGLAWAREDQPEPAVGDRRFRRRLLSTRPGTSIDASTDAADDGSLRETECIEVRWRDDRSRDAGLVAMVGYAFIHTAKANDKYPAERRRLDGVDTIFVGGDTRYGLGRLHRVAFDLVKQGGAFGGAVALDADLPQVDASTAWAHAHAQAPLRGSLELLGGWDRGLIRSLDQAVPLWQPGSRSTNHIRWSIEADGLWRATP